VGLSQTKATARLQAAGFAVEVVYQATETRRENGRVISQAPGAGAELEKGYPVAIIVGQYAPPAQDEEPVPPPDSGDGD
jgi:beta-lactam-binding protein with PASTA domain